MRGSDAIILGWLKLSFLRADTAVTSMQLVSKNLVWPHKNELFSSFGKQTGVDEAVLDKSKVLS